MGGGVRREDDCLFRFLVFYMFIEMRMCVLEAAAGGACRRDDHEIFQGSFHVFHTSFLVVVWYYTCVQGHICTFLASSRGNMLIFVLNF